MNAHGKEVDKTYLSIDQAEDRGFIHRDYIAHCLRWSHVCKRLYERNSYRTARILDVGCGRELPMAKMLYSSKLIPQMYYGVDVGPINDEDAAKITKTGKFPHKLWERCNVLELTIEDVLLDEPHAVPDSRPNIVTCFEVLEHVEPKMMFEMLEHIKSLTTPDARFFFSTPNWNRTDCAGNHVNEMLYEALGAGFERHGFIVEHVYGTFASIRDYEHMLGDKHLVQDIRDDSSHVIGPNTITLARVFEKLREYYDTNFLSCVFAPLFPAQSRNALWELRKHEHGPVTSNNRFFPIDAIQRPWSSSAKWEDMAL